MTQITMCAVVVCLVIGLPGLAGADWDEVEAILQRKGERAGSSISFSYPRIDRRPGKGKRQEFCPSSMMSGVTFRKTGNRLAELEGDIVAMPREKQAVERKLLAEGLRITKVEKVTGSRGETRIHFSGWGNPAALVWAFTPALSVTDTPMGPPLFTAGHRCIEPAK